MSWFRVHDELLEDRKLARVARDTKMDLLIVRGAWVSLLALASQSSMRGTLMLDSRTALTTADIADTFHTDETIAERLVAAFKERDMLAEDAQGVLYPLNWDKRQFESDTSTERVKRYRDRRRQLGMTQTGSYSTATVTARDGNCCIYCGSNENLCVDHILPTIMGGTDDMDNLACACKQCNSGKAGRTPQQAGYGFQNRDAEARFNSYMSRHVTVAATDHIRSDQIISDMKGECENLSGQENPIDQMNPFLEVFSVLKGIKGYPFSATQDTEMLTRLHVRYPGVNLLDVANDMAVWLLGKPIDSKSNPRGRFNTFVKNAAERLPPGGNGSQPVAGPPKPFSPHPQLDREMEMIAKINEDMEKEWLEEQAAKAAAEGEG